MKQILELIPDVELFLQSNDEFSLTTFSNLLTLLSDPQKRTLLKVEFSAIVDFGHQFVTTTYK